MFELQANVREIERSQVPKEGTPPLALTTVESPESPGKTSTPKTTTSEGGTFTSEGGHCASSEGERTIPPREVCTSEGENSAKSTSGKWARKLRNRQARKIMKL